MAVSIVDLVFECVARVVGGIVVLGAASPFEFFPLGMVVGWGGEDVRFPPALVGFLCPPSLLLLVPSYILPPNIASTPSQR